MTPKKDEYMRGYGDGFKDGSASTAGEREALMSIGEELGLSSVTAFNCIDEIRKLKARTTSVTPHRSARRTRE